MPKEDRSLSDFARALLAAERTSREHAQLKERALARARRALLAQRLSGGDLLRSVNPHAGVLRGRTPRVALLAAAALAMAGLAAASAGLLREPEGVGVVPSSAPAHGPAPHPAAPRPAAARPAAPAAPDPAPQEAASVASDMLSRPTPVRLPNPTRVHAPSAPTSADSEATRRDATSAQTYAIELALLEPARSATVRGSYAEALGAIARHQREFPNGQLAEERSALRVRALWGLGRTAEAEAAAASFRQSYPRSALLAWMRPRSASPR